MPFQVIRSPGFTCDPFQVILITLGLTFQNLAVDKTNNCKIPLSKVPVRVWVMTSSLTRSNVQRSLKVVQIWERKDSFPVSKVCLTQNWPHSTQFYFFMWNSLVWYRHKSYNNLKSFTFMVNLYFGSIFYPLPVHILDFQFTSHNPLKSHEPWLLGSRFRNGGSRDWVG